MAEVMRDTMASSRAAHMVRKTARESTKQEPDVRDVVNTRVWNMFREAVDFKSEAINPFQKGMADLETATLNLFEGTLPLLRAPLPRVWDTVEGGLAEPIRATISHNHPNIAGGEMNDTAIRAAAQEFEARLQLKVRRPLTQWSDALETVRERFPELERLRTRLQRRTAKVINMEKKAEKEQRKRMGVKRGGLSTRGKGVSKPGAGGISGALFRCTHPHADEGIDEYELREPASAEGGASQPTGQYVEGVEDDVMAREFQREDRDVKLKNRQRKLEVAREAFAAEEALLYEQLSGLCRDSAWTKSYIAAALLMAKELYQESVFNLGDTLQPLPACKSLASARGLGETPSEAEGAETFEGFEVPVAVSGRLGSNMAYNASMPEFATRARARGVLDELQKLASRRSHPARVTASPLELHAAQDSRERGGSSGRPSLAPPGASRSGRATPTSRRTTGGIPTYTVAE